MTQYRYYNQGNPDDPNGSAVPISDVAELITTLMDQETDGKGEELCTLTAHCINH